jgi:hypothetical protein
MSSFARYGLPLFSSFWLGLPDGIGTQRIDDLGVALQNARKPEVPKVAVTLFKPVETREQTANKTSDRPGLTRLTPDVEGTLS